MCFVMLERSMCNTVNTDKKIIRELIKYYLSIFLQLSFNGPLVYR